MFNPSKFQALAVGTNKKILKNTQTLTKQN